MKNFSWKETNKTKQNKIEAEQKSAYHLFILIHVLMVDFKKD